jgi:hypothetical protein
MGFIGQAMADTYTPEIKTQKLAQLTPDLDKLANLFIGTFPQLNIDEQGLTLKLYQLLSGGSADR